MRMIFANLKYLHITNKFTYQYIYVFQYKSFVLFLEQGYFSHNKGVNLHRKRKYNRI